MSGIKDGLSNVVEKILDPALNIGVLSCLGLSAPEVVSSIGVYGLINATHSWSSAIHAEHFIKHLSSVTFELQSVSEEDRIKFFNIHGDKTVKDIGEGVILLLNKIEMPLAANMIGRSHRLLMQEEISEEIFHNYCHVIKNLNQYIYDNLVSVYGDPDKKIFEGGVFSLMESLGLTFEVQEGLFPSDASDDDNPKPNKRRYMKTDFGKEFYKRIIEPYVL